MSSCSRSISRRVCSINPLVLAVRSLSSDISALLLSGAIFPGLIFSSRRRIFRLIRRTVEGRLCSSLARPSTLSTCQALPNQPARQRRPGPVAAIISASRVARPTQQRLRNSRVFTTSSCSSLPRCTHTGTENAITIDPLPADPAFNPYQQRHICGCCCACENMVIDPQDLLPSLWRDPPAPDARSVYRLRNLK